MSLLMSKSYHSIKYALRNIVFFFFAQKLLLYGLVGMLQSCSNIL